MTASYFETLWRESWFFFNRASLISQYLLLIASFRSLTLRTINKRKIETKAYQYILVMRRFLAVYHGYPRRNLYFLGI